MTKLAQGLLDLHSQRGAVDLAALAGLAVKAGGSRELGRRILAANTAADAFAHAEAEGVALGDVVARARGRPRRRCRRRRSSWRSWCSTATAGSSATRRSAPLTTAPPRNRRR